MPGNIENYTPDPEKFQIYLNGKQNLQDHF